MHRLRSFPSRQCAVARMQRIGGCGIRERPDDRPGGTRGRWRLSCSRKRLGGRRRPLYRRGRQRSALFGSPGNGAMACADQRLLSSGSGNGALSVYRSIENTIAARSRSRGRVLDAAPARPEFLRKPTELLQRRTLAGLASFCREQQQYASAYGVRGVFSHLLCDPDLQKRRTKVNASSGSRVGNFAPSASRNKA